MKTAGKITERTERIEASSESSGPTKTRMIILHSRECHQSKEWEQDTRLYLRSRESITTMDAS
jgi:hypothetical protein